MIELFDKGEESLLDIPSADLPKIPTIPAVYVRTRTFTAQCSINSIICVYICSDCDFETKLQLRRERDEIKKLHNETSSLRMDVNCYSPIM